MKSFQTSIVAICLLLVIPFAVIAEGGMPFGDKGSIAFSERLWDALVEADLAGPDRINVQPFEGNEPHGSIQQVLASEVTVDGRTAEVLVKHNHGGPDLSVQDVYDDPNENLKVVTVMFKRENGYDPDNQNWFWAKYFPDGSLDTNPKGMKLAGRVAKGMSQGCIACHGPLGRSDMETLTSQ
ncbi:MAG: hypothetical protein U5O39_10715 [Gammaproteobacteria bacterium]|nr:hypothetical protein [Gammaproteobacteria bacterium]